MFKNLINTVFDNRFKIVILEGKASISNYEDIIIFDDERVLIKVFQKTIKITGSDLVITKLLNKELLVEGKILSIEFR